MSQSESVYKYYLFGRERITFPSYRACLEYYQQLTLQELINVYYNGYFIVRENRRTGTKVLFEQSFYKLYKPIV